MITQIQDNTPKFSIEMLDAVDSSMVVIESIKTRIVEIGSNATFTYSYAISSYEWPVLSNGAASLTVPFSFIKVTNLYINGLLQSKSTILVNNNQLVMPSDFNLIAGDVVAVDLII